MADEKWKGKATVEVKGVTADQTWSLLSDFCNLQKCMPNIDQCIKLEGEDGKPGLVRHVRHHVTTTTTDEEQQQQQPLSAQDTVDEKNDAVWAVEKLVMIDETERFLSYVMIDNNFGLKSYEADFKAVEVEDGEEGEEQVNSGVEWSYIADPIEGMKIEDFEVQRAYLLHSMVLKIQAHFSVTAGSVRD